MDFVSWACHNVRPDDLQLGDHIYVWDSLGIHTHHGIVTSILEEPTMHAVPLEDRVVVTHFSPLNTSSFPLKNAFDILSGVGVMSLVFNIPLREFVGVHSSFGGLKRARYGVPRAEYWFKRAGTCYQETPDPVQVALCRARMLSDEHNKLEQVYSVRNANCEHMAFWCKTGIWRSAQISNLPSQLLFAPPKVMGGLITNVVASAVTFLDENLPYFPVPESPQTTSREPAEFDYSSVVSSDTPENDKLSEFERQAKLLQYAAENREMQERALMAQEERDIGEREQMLLEAELFYCASESTERTLFSPVSNPDSLTDSNTVPSADSLMADYVVADMIQQEREESSSEETGSGQTHSSQGTTSANVSDDLENEYEIL